MWRELPAETRDWSEEDWELFFRRQDEQHFAEMQARGQPSFDQLAEEPLTSTVEELLDGLDEDSLLDEAVGCDAELGDALSRIPSWRAAVEFCDRTIEFVSPRVESERGKPVEFIAQTLATESYLVPDYILAGHELGYDEGTLCGNIALCVRSRRSLERCVQCLKQLGGATDDRCRKLIRRAIVTSVFLDRRISDLRSRVWWR